MWWVIAFVALHVSMLTHMAQSASRKQQAIALGLLVMSNVKGRQQQTKANISTFKSRTKNTHSTTQTKG